MMKIRATLVALGAVASFQAVAAPVRYDAQEIAAPAGVEVQPFAVNVAGQVVGTAYEPGTLASFAFATGAGGQGFFRPCPTDPAPTGCMGKGIDDNGRVLLSLYYPNPWGGTTYRGATASVDGSDLKKVGMLPGANHRGDQDVMALSPTGKVTGYASNALGRYQAFVGQEPARRLRGLAPGGDMSAGFAVNDAGVVVGLKWSGPEFHAFAALPDGQRVWELPGLTQPLALSNTGLVAGFTWVADGQTHAMLTRLHDAPTPRDLGTLGGTYSVAHGVNDAGLVTGVATLADGRAHAFVYDSATGRMHDLNDLVSMPPGVELMTAGQINALGQIVAFGSNLRGYVLTPR